MIGVIAKLKIKEGERVNFTVNMAKLVKAVADNEPDCFYYEMHETEDPNTIMMIELYKTEEAHANHSKTEHFGVLGMALAPFLDGAPEITVHKQLKGWTEKNLSKVC